MSNDSNIRATNKMSIELNRDNKTFTLIGEYDDVNLYLIPKDRYKKITYTFDSDGVNVSTSLDELLQVKLTIRSPAFGPVFDNIRAGLPLFTKSKVYYSRLMACH